MADVNVRVIIDAVDKATAEINKVGSSIGDLGKSVGGVERTLSSFSGALENVGKSLTFRLTVPLVGAGIAVSSFLKDAGKLESVTDAFNTMTKSWGINAQRLIDSVQKASRNTVSEADVMRGGLKLMSLVGKEALGDFGKTFPKIAELAKKASRVTGAEVSFMLESIINGVGRNSVMWLDNTGIVVKADEAYKKMADSLKINTTELTVSQQKQALLNAWIEKAEKTYKDVAVTSGGYAGTLEKLTSDMEDQKDKLALALLPTFTDFLKKVLIPLSKDILPAVADILKKVTDAFGNLSPQAQKSLIIFLGLAAILGPLALLLSTLISPITLIVAALGVMVVNWSQAMSNLKIITEGTVLLIKENLRGLGLAFETLKDRVEINTKAMAEVAANNMDAMRINLEQMFWRIRTNAISIFDQLKNDIEYYFNRIKNWVASNWANWGINLSIPDFNGLWNSIKKVLEDIRNKIGSMWATWGINISVPDINAMIQRFKNIPNWVREQINKLPSFLKGIAEQVYSLSGGVPSFQKGGIVGGVRGEPQLAVVHGGERIMPAISGQSRGGETNITFNFSGTFLGSQNEMRVYAMKIWESLGQVAASQNKSPSELLNLRI